MHRRKRRDHASSKSLAKNPLRKVEIHAAGNVVRHCSTHAGRSGRGYDSQLGMANRHLNRERTVPRNERWKIEFLERQVCLGRLPSARAVLPIIRNNHDKLEMRRFVDRDEDSASRRRTKRRCVEMARRRNVTHRRVCLNNTRRQT